MSHQVVTIFGFIVQVKNGFDPYAAWALYASMKNVNQENYHEHKLSFVEDLVDIGKATVATQEQLGEQAHLYFESIGAKLFIEAIPTAADFDALQVALGEVYNDLNSHDRELLASGYHSPVVKNADLNSADYFAILNSTRLDEVFAKRQHQITIAMSWMKANEERAKAKQGFAIYHVFNDKPGDWKSLSYTEGLKESLGCEMILIDGGPQAGNVLAHAASKLIENPSIIGSVFENSNFHIAKSALRMKILDVPEDSNTAKQISASCKINVPLKQAWVADKNNILIGEPGYDETYKQTMESYD